MSHHSEKGLSRYKKDNYLHLSPEEQDWALSVRNATVGFKELKEKLKNEQEEKIREIKNQIEEKQIKRIKIEKISALFQENEGVAIENIVETLDMSRNELFDFLIENNKILGDIRISDGKMFIANQEDISEFIKILDGQFKKWEIGKKSEKMNPGFEEVKKNYG